MAGGIARKVIHPRPLAGSLVLTMRPARSEEGLAEDGSGSRCSGPGVGGGRSQRSVAREQGVSRNTVRKYLDWSEPRRVESKPRRRWVTERVGPRLNELLRAWPRRTTAKHRLTPTRLHWQLLEAGYEVGITPVRSYVREWKRVRRETFIPLVHRAGESGQVDFVEVTVTMPTFSPPRVPPIEPA